MSTHKQFERFNSHLSQEYGRIKSNEFRINNDLYGEYDNAPPTTPPKEAPSSEESTSSISYYAKMYVKKFLSICATGFALLFQLLCVVFTVFIIFIGCYYVNSCSCQPFIPIYLIVTGCLFCFLIFYAVYQYCKPVDYSESYWEFSEASMNIFRYIKDLLTLFVFAWFIAGSVTVYEIYWKINFQNVTAECYCQPLLYRCTFWSITSFYIIMAFVLCIGLFGMFIKYLYSFCHNGEY